MRKRYPSKGELPGLGVDVLAFLDRSTTHLSHVKPGFRVVKLANAKPGHIRWTGVGYMPPGISVLYWYSLAELDSPADPSSGPAATPSSEPVAIPSSEPAATPPEGVSTVHTYAVKEATPELECWITEEPDFAVWFSNWCRSVENALKAFGYGEQEFIAAGEHIGSAGLLAMNHEALAVVRAVQSTHAAYSKWMTQWLS